MPEQCRDTVQDIPLAKRICHRMQAACREDADGAAIIQSYIESNAFIGMTKPILRKHTA